jgi:hypothetical protein
MEIHGLFQRRRNKTTDPSRVELEHDAHTPLPVGRRSCRWRGRTCKGASSCLRGYGHLLSSRRRRQSPKSQVTHDTRTRCMTIGLYL